MNGKVLISMPWAPQNVTELDSYMRMMEAHGFETKLDPKQWRLTEEELLERLPGVCALVCGGDALTRRVLGSKAAASLKIISRFGVGVETVDIEAATENGIAVTNAPGVNAEGVAEYTAALMLAAARKIISADAIVRGGGWDKANGISLFRKTLGIVGFGSIGRTLAKLLSGFDMKILACDPHPRATSGVEFCRLEQLLSQSDFISLHTPLTPATRDLISAREFSLMKRNAVIVNCARGGIVNEDALYKALAEHRIAGAALDVFAQEPLETGSRLLTLDNLIVSPHNAAASVETMNKALLTALQNVISVLSGEKVRGLLNPEVMALFPLRQEQPQAGTVA